MVRFLLPEAPEVIENAQFGPLWSFGVKNETGRPYLTLLVPMKEEAEAAAAYDAASRVVRVTGAGMSDTIHLPQPGSPDLPRVQRG